MRGNRHKLKQERVKLDSRKIFFAVWAVKDWNGLLREIVQALSVVV